MTTGSRASLALDDLIAAAPDDWETAAPVGSTPRWWLGLLLQSLEAEAGLSAYGQYLARTDLLRSARAAAEEADRPRVRGAVPGPVVVIGGLPRTGTTLLHTIGSNAGGTWVPRTWEYDRPGLIGTTDETVQRAAAAESTVRLEGFARLVPDFAAVHPMAADAPEECDALFVHRFESLRLLVQHDIATYRSAWLASDHRQCYSLLAASLHRLGAGRDGGGPSPIPILKAPGHMHAYDTLRAFVPDAVVVQIHRPVATVLASWADLVQRARSAFSLRVAARDHLLEEWLDTFSLMVARGLAARRARPDGWIAVSYRDLVADPDREWSRVAREARLPGLGRSLGSTGTPGPRPIHAYSRSVPPDLARRIDELDERYRSLVFG